MAILLKRQLNDEEKEIILKQHGRRCYANGHLIPDGDPNYVDCEIQSLTEKALTRDRESFGRNFRAALIRSLLQSDSEARPGRMRNLVANAKNGGDLEFVSDLLAVRGSSFVFQFSDIVRSILTRGKELNVEAEVRETLLLSACGGSRSFSGHELDPEYRYILEQGDALANRFRDDPLLGSFYRAVATYERKNLELHKSMFRDDDDFD